MGDQEYDEVEMTPGEVMFWNLVSWVGVAAGIVAGLAWRFFR